MTQTIPSSLSRRAALLGVSLLLGAGAANAQSSSLTLEAALQALPGSADWRVTDLTYQNAQRNFESARAALGIQVNAGGQYSLVSPTAGGTPQQQPLSDSNNASLSVTASASVLPWSPAAAQFKLAERAFGRAGLDRDDSRRTILVNAVTAYFNARAATLDVRLAQGNQGLAEARLGVATAQQGNGQITREQALTAQQTLENAKINSQLATNNAVIARLTLSNALGLNAASLELTTAPTALALPAGPLEELIAAALGQRSDLARASSRVRDAEDTLAAAQLNRLLPNANLSLGYGVLGTTGSGSPSVTGSLNVQSGTASVSASLPVVQSPAPVSPVSGFSLSLSVSLPVLAPSTDAGIRSAESALESAKAALETAKRSADLDVRQRSSEASIATARVETARLGVQSARLALETAKARNGAGLNTALDVRTAEQAVAQSERDFESAVSTQYTAVLRLQNALGSLSLPFKEPA